jgi:hypothetical protein
LGTAGTFNCVTTSPGTNTPVTVGSGGYVTISWNPQ